MFRDTEVGWWRYLFRNTRTQPVHEPEGPNLTTRGEHPPEERAGALWDPLEPLGGMRPFVWGALGLFTTVFRLRTFLDALRPARDHGVDFFQDWASAKNLVSRTAVYSPLSHATRRYLGLDPATIQVHIPYNAHPPTSVLLALPFVLLDYPNATLLWNLASLAALAVSLWLIRRGLELRWAPWVAFPLVTLLLLCSPLLQQLIQGQHNLVLLLLLCWTWYAERTGRPWSAGAALGVATTVKLFPGFLVAHYALQRRWRVVGGAVAAAVLSTAVTLVVLGAGAYWEYVGTVLPKLREYCGSWINLSVPGWWYKLLQPEGAANPPTAPLIARLGALASCAALLVPVLRRAHRARHDREQRDHAFVTSLVAMLIVSPITWDHYLVVLALPVAAGLMRARHAAAMRIPLLIILLVFWLDPNLLRAAALWTGWSRGTYTVTILSLQCYALVGYLVLWLTIGARAP